MSESYYIVNFSKGEFVDFFNLLPRNGDELWTSLCSVSEGHETIQPAGITTYLVQFILKNRNEEDKSLKGSWFGDIVVVFSGQDQCKPNDPMMKKLWARIPEEIMEMKSRYWPGLKFKDSKRYEEKDPTALLEYFTDISKELGKELNLFCKKLKENNSKLENESHFYFAEN